MLPLIATKLHPPRERRTLVRRSRLLARLTAGLAGRLTLVMAPAGFGKTTLVADWLTTELPTLDPPPRTAWLSLDEGDNDPARFLMYLVAALQGVAEGLGQGLLAQAQGGALPSPEQVAAEVVNALDALPYPCLLVLDDYHVLHTPLLHEWLTHLLDHTPPTLTLVLTTREEPPLPLPRLRARGHLTEITPQALRFTAPEATHFLNEGMGLHLSADEIAALDAQTEGWIAGLHLAALSLQGQSDPAPFIAAFRGSHRHILDYLAAEVLERQPDALQSFLSQTALLDRLCAPLCDAVTGRTDSQQLLRQIEQRHLFLLPLDDHREWYRYHALFADFLRARLPASAHAPLHQAAARWYRAQGFVEEAVRHVLAGGDETQTVEIVGWAATHALETGEFRALLGWLARLPAEVVQHHLDLATAQGWGLYLAGDLEGAERYATAAEEALPVTPDPDSRSSLVSLRAFIALARGFLDEGIALATEALALAERAAPSFRSVVLLNLAQAQAQRGTLPAALENYREAARLGQQAGNPFVIVNALANLSLLLDVLGQRREAVALCQQALEVSGYAQGQPLPAASLALVSLARLLYEANELEQALTSLQEGIALGQRLGMASGSFLGWVLLAQIQQANGEPDAARASLREAATLADNLATFPARAVMESLEADLALRQGNLALAAQWATTVRVASTDALHPAREPAHLTYARLLLAQGKASEAHALLHRLEDAARAAGRNGRLIPIHLLQSMALRALAREPEALSHLAQALALAAPEGTLRPFLDVGAALAPLLSRVRHVVPAFVAHLLTLLPASPLHPTLVESLSERELDVLRLMADGLSNPEIAARLILSVGTVKSHAHHIYGKLGTRNRTEAILQAQRLGLL